MNTHTHFVSIKEMMTRFLIIILLVLILSACSLKSQTEEANCRVDMEMRVTINVIDVKPTVFFDQLAQELDCDISVSTFVRKHVTLQAQNVMVSEVLARACSQIGCKYVLNENQLAIKPLTIIDRMRAKQWEEFYKMIEEHNKILQSRLPQDMTFDDVPLSNVLDEISKVSGLEIRPWKDEGDRKVTLDVGGMTIEEAIKAVLLYVDSEGAVLIRQKYFLHNSWGQYWPWGYPPNR